MTEQQLQTKIIKFLESQDNTWVTKTINVSKAGCPDIIACIDGVFYGIEVKDEKGKLSEIQKVVKNKILKASGWYVVVRPSDFEEFKKDVKADTLHLFGNQ